VDSEIDPCIDYIHQGILKKEGTLVVCTAGMSRSATVCIAYLIKYQAKTYQEAFDLAKKARVYVNPNKGFVKFLKEYETSLMPQKLSKKADCELCNLEKKTQWFERHTDD